MSKLIHFLNGKFVTEDELLISPRDLGFVRGYGVADFIVTHNHQLFKLSEHIDRLFNSAQIIGLKIPWTKEQIKKWTQETIDKNDKKTEKTIKIILSGGNSHSMKQTEIPTIVMIVSDYEKKPEIYYTEGVKVKVVHYKRQYSQAKHTHYVESIRQRAKYNNEAIDDIIYFDDTQVFEGSGSNLFAVIDNKLVTPKTNIVEGITRNTLLEILKLDIPIEVRDFSHDELKKATEMFLTGSSNGVRGVTEVNGHALGNGRVGEITKQVMKQYTDFISTHQN